MNTLNGALDGELANFLNEYFEYNCPDSSTPYAFFSPGYASNAAWQVIKGSLVWEKVVWGVGAMLPWEIVGKLYLEKKQ